MNLFYLSEWRVLYCTLSSDIGFLTLGLNYGFPSPIAREIKNSNILNGYQYGIFTGAFFLSAAISGLIAMPLMYCLGRKPVIIVGASISSAGWMIIGFSRVPAVLIFGRVVTGLGSGLSIPILPIYVAELAHKSTRGRHLSISGISISSGILTIYILGILLNYAWIAYIVSFLCLLQIFLLSIAPYTPTYLLRRELDKRALSTLKRLRNKEYDSIKEIEEIKVILKEENIPFRSKLSFLCKPYILKAGFVAILLLVANQTAGVSLFSSYTSSLLANGSIDPNLIGLVLPIGLIISSIINMILIDKVGRKALLLVSIIGVITSHILMATYFTTVDQICPQVNSPNNSAYFAVCQSPSIIAWPILSIILFGTSFTLGCGPIGYIVLGEIIPLKVKHIFTGAGITILFITGFLISTLYPIISARVPRSYFLFALALVNIVIGILVCLFVPETKGKSITELEKLFQGNTIFCWFKKTQNKIYSNMV